MGKVKYLFLKFVPHQYLMLLLQIPQPSTRACGVTNSFGESTARTETQNYIGKMFSCGRNKVKLVEMLAKIRSVTCWCHAELHFPPREGNVGCSDTESSALQWMELSRLDMYNLMCTNSTLEIQTRGAHIYCWVKKGKVLLSKDQIWIVQAVFKDE